SLQIRIRLFGKDNQHYASSMNNFALVYHKLGNYTKAIEAFKDYTDIVENLVLKMFLGSNKGMRETFWNGHAGAFNSVYPSDYFDYWDVLSKEQRDFYACDVYNKSALFAKGLLLNTELEVSKLIDEANDPEVKQIYTTLKENRDYLSKLYEMEVSKRPVSTDSIEQLSQRLELQLHQKLKSFGDFTNNLRTTWLDVQNKLKDNDLAIEFLTSTIDDDNNDRYFALVIKKGYKAPHMIPLFKGEEIKAIDKNEIYTTSALSNLLWKPMEEELEGITNVYFSPIGALHNIGIEYLPMEDGMNISEKYNLCRLSSTRQLTIERQKPSDWNAVLYGGIQYDADTSILMDENRQYDIGDDERITPESHNPAIENSSVRGGCGYLSGTRVEVENISSTFDSDAIMYQKYIGISGTEESFKSLSGTKPNVLHIATHGFYWTETDAEKIKRIHEEMQFLNSDNTDRTTEEDKAMTRSGLMLAGSNRTIKGEKLPPNVDDGILTAKEISKLDFRGLDLVVLSACQTALGDISGSEGVFGLQRAFKKAGAQTLLMSLWKVNDTATEMLMSEFYQNLVLGKTKRQSFIEAQSWLRDIDPDPNHWAAFIMLDALE
ncbi:MAG: CHAT domain-containing protein, partial [Prevotella sp.]|nr:CHAT domain-containing protein [Prevotella sp.]